MKTKLAHFACPIMAVLATRHGIRLVSSNGILLELAIETNQIEWLINGCPFTGLFFFIHPDDMHLLEPKEGDKNVNGFIYQNGRWIDDPLMPSNFDYGTMQTDWRNNMPFPWPKFEGAE